MQEPRSTLARPGHHVCPSSTPFQLLYNFLCCSKKIIVHIVCGPNRMKLGTQPLKHHNQPSVFCAFASISSKGILPPALITRVLMTSTGEQIVVATNPAHNEDTKCVYMLSLKWKLATNMFLKMSYEASCEAFMRRARDELAPMPRNMLLIPSSLTIL